MSRLRLLALLSAVVAVTAPPALAQGAVPPALQATTFDKIFGFDRALGDRTRLKVLLVHDAAGRDLAAQLQQAFTAAAIPAEAVAPAAAASRLEGGGVVVYLLPGTATPELLKAAADAKALTIAGDAALAEQGRASVGLAMRGDKADIVVNLDRVEQEGHDFSAQLLKFARVVRGGSVAAGGAAATAAPAPPAGGGGTPPVLVGINKPPYPTLARRFNIEGDVVMRLMVDASGKVTDVELLKGVGRGGIDEAAVAAARTARFRPAVKNGTAAPGTYVLTMPFRL